MDCDNITKESQEILDNLEKKKQIRHYNWTQLTQMTKDSEILEWPCVKPEDILLICFTSGTTGVPKGALLSQSNMLATVWERGDEMAHMDEFVGEHFVIRELAFIPYAHISQYDLLIRNLFNRGQHGVFQNTIDNLLEDFDLFKPTYMFSSPRVYNKFHKIMENKISEMNFIKRALFKKAFNDKVYWLHNGNHYKHKFWDWLVFKPFRDLLGGNLKLMTSAAAPLGADVYEYFKVVLSAGFPQLYGSTEGGILTVQDPFDPNCDNTGIVTKQLEFKIVDHSAMNYLVTDCNEEGKLRPRGEICFRGPSVLKTYYKNDEKTKEAFTEDGFYKSGDIVEFDTDTNSVKIIDRKKAIFKLSRGQYIAPEYLENVYKGAPVLSDIYIHGESIRNFIVAVVNIEPEQFKIFGKNIPGSTFEEQIVSPEGRK